MPCPLTARPGGGDDASAEQLRVARLDGAVIGACRITPEVMRLGESRLKLGVIRNLAVHPQFDPRTVRGALLADARTFLSRHRYHVALTTGFEFELRRHGFTPVYRQFACRLTLDRDASMHWDPLRVRPAKHGHIPAMSRLYNATFEAVPGSLLRSRAQMSRIWSEYEASCVVTDREGKVIAYFVPRTRDTALYIVEFGYADPLTPRDLKELIREFADVAECASAIVTGPKAILTRFGGNAPLIHTHDVPEGFAACIDPDELFQSMVPEWESLLAATVDEDRELTVVVSGTPYRIRCHHGAVTVDTENGSNRIALTPAQLTHALLGAVDPESILRQEMRLLNAAAVEFFKSLFPLREPGISPIDLL